MIDINAILAAIKEKGGEECPYELEFRFYDGTTEIELEFKVYMCDETVFGSCLYTGKIKTDEDTEMFMELQKEIVKRYRVRKQYDREYMLLRLAEAVDFYYEARQAMEDDMAEEMHKTLLFKDLGIGNVLNGYDVPEPTIDDFTIEQLERMYSTEILNEW